MFSPPWTPLGGRAAPRVANWSWMVGDVSSHLPDITAPISHARSEFSARRARTGLILGTLLTGNPGAPRRIPEQWLIAARDAAVSDQIRMALSPAVRARLDADSVREIAGATQRVRRALLASQAWARHSHPATTWVASTGPVSLCAPLVVGGVR